MITIKRTTFNEITMKAKGTDDDGRDVDLELTWAFAPELSAYNLTDRCWLANSEWRFDYPEIEVDDDPECGLHGDMGPGVPIYR